MKKPILFTLLALLPATTAQQTNVKIEIIGGPNTPALAVAEMRGSGAAQNFMAAFNRTLHDDLDASGLFKLVPRSLYPLGTPQQPADFRGVTAPPAFRNTGYYLSDWSGPPPQAGYLVFGYTAAQNNVLVLYGYLYNVTQQSIQAAQAIGNRYTGDVSEAGARKVAHEFAADIIARFGGTSLIGTHIYFVSDRTGAKEIWSMDPDGSNQRQLTRYRFLTIEPAVSADGKTLAFTSYAKGNPRIFVSTAETGRMLSFRNPAASMTITASFTPDGQHILYASTAAGGPLQIYIANLDGGDARRVSYRRAIEVDPKVNPKTGNDILFVSGPPPQQIYKMDMSGASVEMVSPGAGEAADPAWHPNGQVMAFAWTRGYATGQFNIFVMDIVSRHFDQLTQNAGRNEHPNWAPDGTHLVFQSNRRGGMQIWTMRADGTGLRQLTTQGHNERPVWGK